MIENKYLLSASVPQAVLGDFYLEMDRLKLLEYLPEFPRTADNGRHNADFPVSRENMNYLLNAFNLFGRGVVFSAKPI